MYDWLIAAHRHTIHNRDALERDTLCGCISCESIFSPTEITDWTDKEPGQDRAVTALCPCCGLDTVIGESSGFPITERFLHFMRRCWFLGFRMSPLSLHLRQYSAILTMRILMEGLLAFAEGEKKWETLVATLEEYGADPAFGLTPGDLPGWLRLTPPETLFAEEFALLRQVLALARQDSGGAAADAAANAADAAKEAIERFFKSEPTLTPERIDLLIGNKVQTCPPFLKLVITPLYGCLLGRVSVEEICGRVALARIRWDHHEERDVLEDDYWAEGALLTALTDLTRDTTPGDETAEAAFRERLLAAMEYYASTWIEREQYLLV